MAIPWARTSLVGRECIAVVYDSDINVQTDSSGSPSPPFIKTEPDKRKIANLQGERLGLFRFFVWGVLRAGSGGDPLDGEAGVLNEAQLSEITNEMLAQ